ncbi:MAG: RNA recognition motif domain-containing protein [Planctomycetota bacterium]
MTTKKLYVGNIPYTATQEQISQLFGQYGQVKAVNIIMDRETNRPRGFCFVEMDGADAAIQALDGKDMGGRALRVNEARERESRPMGGGGPRMGGGGRGGFRGGDRGGRGGYDG